MEINGNNLKLALRGAGITQEKAAKELGVTRQTIGNWVNRGKLDASILQNVKDILGIDLLQYDKDGTKSNPRLEAKPLHLASSTEDFNNDGSKYEELGDGVLRMRVPIVNERGFAGYLRGFKDPEYLEELPTMSIDVYKEAHGNYLAFEVVGDSMTTLEPMLFRESIFDGSLVVGRELMQHHWRYKLHTHKFNAWVIVHKTEGILIKNIIKHDTETGIITIHSLNPNKEEYPDQDLHLDDIQQIFNIVKVVTNK